MLVSGATLSFNFTERRIEPVLDVAALDNENTDPNGTIQVFVSGKRPTGGKHVLTSGGLFGERNIVFAQGGQPDWAKEIDKDEDGNIILEVKPKATMIIIR